MAKEQNWFRQDIKRPLAIIWIAFLILEQGLGVDVRFPFGLDLVVRIGGFISIVVLGVRWVVRKLKEQGRVVERNEKIWEDVPRKQTGIGSEKTTDTAREKIGLTSHELAVLSSELEKKKKSVGIEEIKVDLKTRSPFVTGFSGCLGIGAAIFAVLLVLSAGGFRITTPKSSEEGPKKVGGGSVAEIPAEPKQTEFNVGEEIKLGDNILKVNSVERRAQVGHSTPDSGKEFVLVNVTIRNAGQGDISYNPYDFRIQDSNGNQTDHAWVSLNDELNSGSLASGGHITGTIPFEAPRGDQGLKLLFEPNFWSEERIVINL